jgi:hypothetical protein
MGVPEVPDVPLDAPDDPLLEVAPLLDALEAPTPASSPTHAMPIVPKRKRLEPIKRSDRMPSGYQRRSDSALVIE